MKILSLLVLSVSLIASNATLVVVDVSETSLATKLAVQTCAGLMNRDESLAGAAFVLGLNAGDKQWLADLEGINESKITAVADMLAKCKKDVAKGYIRFNLTLQKLILPNIVTMAGVLDAIPLEDGDSTSAGLALVFDALDKMGGFSALQATSYVYENHGHQTTTMAKLNPGLDTHEIKHVFNPRLTGSLNPALVDFVVKERLFAFFLNNGCIPLTEEHSLMKKMVENNPWPRPIPVYGYDDTYGIGGDLFEAETTCVPEHNMGQIATAGASNLAFFSRKPPISTPLSQNPETQVGPFNESKTYIAFVVGDGDNIDFLKGSRKTWLEQRVNNCREGKGCFPLLWTLSPQILHLSPDMARWYFNQSYLTKHDYFVLPPSGDLYSYPGMMSVKDQSSFVTNTERDSRLLNTSGIVTWEWFTWWHKAIRDFYPQYSKNGIVRSAYAVNVPFNLPTLQFRPHEFYKVLNDRFVLFRPFEWRGTSESTSIPFGKHNLLSIKHMGKLINGYPKGTVTAIYMTSDGGAKLQDFYDLVQELDEHVEVVSHTALADMALSSARGTVLSI